MSSEDDVQTMSASDFAAEYLQRENMMLRFEIERLKMAMQHQTHVWSRMVEGLEAQVQTLELQKNYSPTKMYKRVTVVLPQ
jgi:hypothetical protein